MQKALENFLFGLTFGMGFAKDAALCVTLWLVLAAVVLAEAVSDRRRTARMMDGFTDN